MIQTNRFFGISAAVLLLATTGHAIKTDKINLKGSMVLDYVAVPGSVESVDAMFREGMVYGRLRMNTFYWDWGTETASQKDNRALGVGGSLVYKTASLDGLSATFGMYTTMAPAFFREDSSDVGLVKAGKDTFDRNKVKNGGGYDGNFGMTTVGQLNLRYDVSKTSIIAGRQLFETVFTKSNDTKMIPNTFDGVSATLKELPDTTVMLGYFTAQKLRDHTDAHDIIAYSSWDENDDSAVNKSLTPELVGTNNTLLVVSATNTSVKNLKANVSYLRVPDVISNVTLEAHYTVPLTSAWSLTPGFRYMKQMDDLDASTPVANLKADATNYSDPNRMDGALYAGRLDVGNDVMLVRFGYSKIADEADIVAPWRGFPTGGFTRAMAQYNWFANTQTSMLRFDYDFGKAGMVKGFKLLSRYAIQDFDDSKPGVQADSDILHIDLTQVLSRQLEMKIRLGFVNGDTDAGKTDISYNEYRLEFNYFF